jgi:hypothetical protein
MDKELNAMNTALSALSDLEQDAQKRVMSWLQERLKITAPESNPPMTPGNPPVKNLPTASQTSIASFSSLAELLSQANTKTDLQRVLIAAAFEQEHKQKKELTGREINQELQHVGYRSTNVTRSIDSLKAKKPKLMIQTKKEGSSKQAKKKYRVTVEGIKAVQDMISKQSTIDEE